MIRSALYRGMVTHRRSRPRRHALSYRVFYLLLELDEIDALSGRLRLFSRDRFNLVAFHGRDHGDGSDRPLRAQIEAHLAQAGLPVGGRIALLCLPRLIGYVFNPLSVYLCHAPDGGLAAIVYEVSNTFGQRHSYVLPVAANARGEPEVRQRIAKRFYVSPFLDMDLIYDLSVKLDRDDLAVSVRASDTEGPILVAAFAGRRGALTDAGLVRAVLAHPFLTLKVVAGIHWEALLIWLKGVGLRQRPPPPAAHATFAQPNQD